MTDKEVLFIAYGALKALDCEVDVNKTLMSIVEGHLFPQPIIIPGDVLLDGTAPTPTASVPR